MENTYLNKSGKGVGKVGRGPKKGPGKRDVLVFPECSDNNGGTQELAPKLNSKGMYHK